MSSAPPTRTDSSKPPPLFDSSYLGHWKAERVNGNVQTAPPSCSSPGPTDANGEAAQAASAAHAASAPPPVSFLQRRTSVAGNILVLKPQKSEAETTKTSKAYLLQRKIGNVLNGSIRLGYRLERPTTLTTDDDDNDNEEDKTSAVSSSNGNGSSSTSLEGLVWQAVPAAPNVAAKANNHNNNNPEESEEPVYEMVKIHVHNNNPQRLAKASNEEDEQQQQNSLAALPMVAEYYRQHPNIEPHVLGTDLVAMEKSTTRHVVSCWYSITPFYNDETTLFDYCVDRSSEDERDDGRIPEAEARVLFRQIVQGLETLQTLRICHGSLSLTNVLIRGEGGGGGALSDDSSKSTKQNKFVTLGGLGSTALRMPVAADDEKDNDSSTTKRALKIQPSLESSTVTVGGTDPMYVAPEVFAGEAFDGTAIDLWAASVMLLVMLVGMQQQQEQSAQRQQAQADDHDDKRQRRGSHHDNSSDHGSSSSLLFAAPVPADWRFTEICVHGRLAQLLEKESSLDLSRTLVDLLQGLLRANPVDRLTLDKVKSHPWLAQDNDEAKK